MKIDGTKSSSDIKKKKNASKNASGDGVFKSMVSDGSSGAEGASGASMSAGIASVDVLLAAQAADDPAQQKAKRRMADRADTILDKLNDLKGAILTNRVTIGHMISIADVVAQHRENINDPNLTAILDEIDLRAHVELAKLKVAQSKI